MGVANGANCSARLKGKPEGERLFVLVHLLLVGVWGGLFSAFWGLSLSLVDCYERLVVFFNAEESPVLLNHKLQVYCC